MFGVWCVVYGVRYLVFDVCCFSLLFVVRCSLFVVRCWLSVVVCWLLVVVLMFIGCWLLVAC